MTDPLHSSHWTRGTQILVVDDSATHLKLLEQTLLREFDTVHLARSGRQAMEIFERERPAFVITDCVMPDLTGFELCERIRATQASYVYIIMVTSIAEKDNVVPVAAVEPASRLVGHPKRRGELRLGGGHVTFATGSRAFKQTLPAIMAWIAEHSDELDPPQER